MLKTLSILSISANTLLSIGTGLAVGNLFVAILSFLPIDAHFKFLTIALAILPTIFIKIEIVNNIKEDELSDLKLRLPFIFFFYLIGGLLYGFLMSEYKKISIIDNLELAFYIFFALVSAYSIKKNKEFTFAIGIFLCMLAFSIFKAGDIYSMNISMFFIQASFAIIDFYLIYILIENGFNIKRVSYGIGIMCLALFFGEIVSNYFYNAVSYLIVFGNIALTLSVFIFYFLWGKNNRKTENYQKKTENYVVKDYEIPLNSHINESDKIDKIISSCPVKFSPQEKEVLKLLIQGETYKKIGLTLQVSESSVKTYVKRISEKLGVQGKDTVIKALKKYNNSKD